VVGVSPFPLFQFPLLTRFIGPAWTSSSKFGAINFSTTLHVHLLPFFFSFFDMEVAPFLATK